MEIAINLHPAAHECAPGSLNCGVFGFSFHGVRTPDNKLITFALGAGKYRGLMLYLEGLFSEEKFRRAKAYKIAMVSVQPPCLHREVLGTTLYYPFTETSHGQIPDYMRSAELPEGEVAYVDIKDVLEEH